ncbi:MAG: hypothetical protein DRI77_15585 [Chloroflexi bacterium]|nr:MAG: hypothetical protein DRI77_15585 [Chloroflexota bacterium]
MRSTVNLGNGDIPDVFWSIKLSQPLAVPPLVADELLLATTRDTSRLAQQAVLHALGLDDGGVRWEQSFEYVMISGLLQATGDCILVALTSTDMLRGAGALLALDAAGEERWRWTAAVQRVSAPAVAGDMVYFTVDTRALVILDLTSGEERARVPLDASASLSAPALAEGVVCIPCRGPQLLALDTNGSLRWRGDVDAPKGAWLDKTPVVVDGRVFATSSAGTVHALGLKDSASLWHSAVGPEGKALTAPVSAGERIYAGARDGLYALDLSDGHVVWHFPTARKIDPQARPVVHSGVVYVTCHDHHLYAVDAAMGKGLWLYEVERRSELPPVLATCGAAAPCVIVADRGGALTAIARPLSAAEHEAAGHWLEAARLRETLGESACAAEHYERATAWQEAARLWGALNRPLRQAAALEQQALVQQEDAQARAELWDQAAELYAGMWQPEKATEAQRAAAHCRGEPFVTVEMEHAGLVVDTETYLKFTVRNEGAGIARSLVIRATGEGFAGGVRKTQRLLTLRAGQAQQQWLHVCPQRAGDHVQMEITLEYAGSSGETQTRQQVLDLAVAATPAQRGAGARYTIIGNGNIVGNGNVVQATKSAPPEAASSAFTPAALRARLQRLDSVEIKSLCLDHFPKVYDKFARGLQRGEMLNLLLAHCRRNPEDAARLASYLS